MSRITYDETMSSSDALIWHIEQDPQLRSTVMSVWFLERPPSHERMRGTVDRMVTQIPRLRQRVIDERPRPSWVKADDFDVDDHYRYEDLGGDAGRDDVLARAQQWVRDPSIAHGHCGNWGSSPGCPMAAEPRAETAPRHRRRCRPDADARRSRGSRAEPAAPARVGRRGHSAGARPLHTSPCPRSCATPSSRSAPPYEAASPFSSW